VLFTVTILGAAVWIIWREVRDTSLAQIATALALMPGWALCAALALTVASYICLAATEVIIARAMGFRVSRLRSALTSASAFAASNSLGFSLASQGAVRLRGYGPAGLSHGQVARLTLVVSLAVSLSGIVTAGLTLAAAPLVFAHALHRPVLAVGAVALLLITPAALWLLAFRRTGPAWIGGGTASPPDARRRGQAAAAGLGDWLASGAALFILLPQPTAAGFAIFLVVFILGSLISAASGVPGGLGVFEAIVISLTPLVAQTHETAAALLVYRLIYSLGPAALLVFAFATLKAISRLRKRSTP
jgi:phosphatidylglycerol lysyltransferase